ncbi:MAG: hypothetical protein K8R59_16495 [Thermoanaerobaculales bacterium]|nr:hypothetical protein [Thermoanaerobaculales bacterium]
MTSNRSVGLGMEIRGRDRVSNRQGPRQRPWIASENRVRDRDRNRNPRPCPSTAAVTAAVDRSVAGGEPNPRPRTESVIGAVGRGGGEPSTDVRYMISSVVFN